MDDISEFNQTRNGAILKIEKEPARSPGRIKGLSDTPVGVSPDLSSGGLLEFAPALPLFLQAIEFEEGDSWTHD